MNSIGFGRNSNILIHAASPTNVDVGEKSVPQKSMETSKAKSLLAALRPSNWRGGTRHVNMTETDETRRAQNQNESLPLAGDENMVGLQQLTHAIPVTSTSNDHLLSFDILRYAVFATTELIDPSLLLGGEQLQNASSSSTILNTMFTFNPTLISTDAAKSIIDSHLTEQITTTIETAIQTANDKFSAKKGASGSVVKIIQVRSKEEVIADLPDEAVNSRAHPFGTGIQIEGEKVGSNSNSSVEGDKSLRYNKIKVSEWVRKEENITHPLIRVAEGPTAPLQAFARTLNHNKNVSEAIENDSENCYSDVPYTLHLYSGGVGDKSAHKAKENKLPTVVLPPASNDFLPPAVATAAASSDDEIITEVPLPTISDLSAFRPVDAQPLVIRLFQDYIPSSQDNRNSSTLSPKGGTSPHHHQGHAANEYDNDDGFGLSSNSHQQQQQILNNNSISDGGTQLLLRNWASVEAVMSRAIVGEQNATTIQPQSQLRSSNSSGSGGGTVSLQRPVPGWVPEIISAVKKDIKRKMEESLRRAQQLNGGNIATMAPPLFRLKYLCFVPFVICHPATTRRINFMFRPRKALSVGGNTDEDKSFQPSSETAQSTEEKRGEAPNDQATTATLVAQNVSLPYKATEPKAFMLALNPENRALGIASLDGVISDSNYIVSILPKYGS